MIDIRERVITYVGAMAALYHLLNVGGVFIRLGFSIPLHVHRAASLTVVLILIFLVYDVRGDRRSEGVPWYDYVLIAISLFSVGFIVAQYNQVLEWGESGRGTALTIVLALLALIVVLEATRRCVGLPLAAVAGFFFIYTLYCNYFPGIMHGRGYPLTRVSHMLYSTMSGIFGIPLGVGATVIICFLAFSQFLSRSGASDTFIRLPLALFGKVRGGPAKAAVVASGAMGMLSGSVLANVTGTGIFTIP